MWQYAVTSTAFMGFVGVQFYLSMINNSSITTLKLRLPSMAKRRLRGCISNVITRPLKQLASIELFFQYIFKIPHIQHSNITHVKLEATECCTMADNFELYHLPDNITQPICVGNVLKPGKLVWLNDKQSVFNKLKQLTVLDLDDFECNKNDFIILSQLTNLQTLSVLSIIEPEFFSLLHRIDRICLRMKTSSCALPYDERDSYITELKNTNSNIEIVQ